MEHLLKTTLKALTIALFVCASMPTSAQVSYSYDAAGNRTVKTITLAKTMKKMARPDTVVVVESATIADFYEDPQNDVVGQAEIKIYPNPTKGALRVDIDGAELSGNDRIEVYDGNGRIVKVCGSLTDSNQIDLSGAANGIYFMRITIGNEQTTWRIIKE
ncbi:MAG: T9SS type A sorting domain-containing protein [Salinivirgaceae bacterium]|nr:T9SS type A sorting domain-containing protein [Salinivirgaceae bacterium]